MSVKITVSAKVHSTLQHAWEAWTTPKHITQWCYASGDWHAPAATSDLREGGKFSTSMAAKDGSMEFAFSGIYHIVTPQTMIEYVLDDGRRVQIHFEEIIPHVFITETFEAENENSEELQRDGWQAILDNFKTYVEELV